MALGLHRRAHHAEDGPQGSVAGSEAGDEGVHRALPWSDGVRVAGFQAERIAAVVETDAGSFGDDTATETLIEAVYERTAVALRVDGAEVGSFPSVREEIRSAACSGRSPAQLGVVFESSSSGFRWSQNSGSPISVQRSSKASFLASTSRWMRSALEGSMEARSKPSRMFSISRAATPWPGGGIS